MQTAMPAEHYLTAGMAVYVTCFLDLILVAYYWATSCMGRT